MEAHEYETALTQIGLMAGLAAAMDTAALANHLTTAETLGPILEPTAYIRGGADNLQDQRELIEAFIPFANAARKLKAKKQHEMDSAQDR